jgi:cephalosporin hydroxylase
MSFRIGQKFIDRDQPPLNTQERDIIDRFHDLYYRRWLAGGDTINLSWFGYTTLKCPLDLWIYQELLVRSQPDVVVETGTKFGGSALFMATIMDMIGHGRVISVDIDPTPDRPKHPRISYIAGSSTDALVMAQVREEAGAGGAMVVLDSDHRAEHVYNEIIAYNSLIPIGGYLIVEDTNINGHPTFPEYGPGPMEAVNQFLSENNEFVVDERCERLLMTLNPRGYLRRKTAKT